jgi:L-arabinose isomerase
MEETLNNDLIEGCMVIIKQMITLADRQKRLVRSKNYAKRCFYV